MQQKQSELQNDLTRLQNDRAYQTAKGEITGLEAQYEAAVATFEEADAKLKEVEQLDADISQRENQLSTKYQKDISKVYEDYETFLTLAGQNVQICANNLDYFMNVLSQSEKVYTREQAKILQSAYNDIIPIIDLQGSLPSAVERENMSRAKESAQTAKELAYSNLQTAQASVASHENQIDEVQGYLDIYATAIVEQNAVVANYQKASTAGTTLKAAQEALEDAVFQASLGDSSNLDIQAAKEAIEEQKKLVEELTEQADGQEVTANVSGTVSAINVTAGGTAGAEQAIAQITVADRGYTIKIPVTAEQARQVRVGDTAEINNYYWGGITATLENIASDPSSMGQGKMLIFRIEGEDLEAGTNLTLSIGQRSANYDCLVPNSAVRTDSNGSFVLVVVAKSSPLGNRYVATRADVQVLASDDTTSAVSGLANGDFVITTSNKPLEAGDLVRLPDNG